MTPLPGASVPRGTLSELSVTFHEDVNARASDFRLLGNRVGEVPLAFTYTRATRTAELTPAFALPDDRYTFTILDTITATGSGGALDGEIGAGSGPDVLPSGNGVPGGNAVVHFSISSPPRRHLRSGR